MEIPVSEARDQLPDLVRRARAGEDIVLTHSGHAEVRLVPVPLARSSALTPASRRALMEALGDAGSRRASAGPTAARSQDFLYDDKTGLPR